MNIKERKKRVVELHNEGHTQREIAKMLDVGKGTVQRDLKSGPLKVDRSKESGPWDKVVQSGPIENVTLKQEIEDLIKAIPPLLPECKKVGYNSELGFHYKNLNTH